jgi:hypothetical protein
LLKIRQMTEKTNNRLNNSQMTIQKKIWFLFDIGNEENMQLYFNSATTLFKSVHFYRICSFLFIRSLIWILKTD